MAGDDDGAKDEFVFPFRRQGKEANSQKESSQWSESCYGLWLKEKSGDGRSQESVCYGINIVHITKRVMNSKINPSSTRGIQVIIEEMAGEDEANLLAKDEDIGEDGMIAYRAPKPKQSKDDEYGNQPTLMENILDNCHQKVIGLNERYEKYRNDPAAAKEIWSELKSGAHKQYETGKRLLSYVKPNEKFLQVNTFVQGHYENLVNWLNKRSDE